MKFENFIAKRITFSGESKKSISNSVLKIAIITVAVGMAVMIITVSTVTGFKNEIYKKIVGFQSHIFIKSRSSNKTFETNPMSKNLPFINKIKKIKGVKHVQSYATKPAIIKTKSEIQGIILKGIDSDFDWSFFKDNLLQGKIVEVTDTAKSRNIIISKNIANKLKLKLNDKLIIYFVQNRLRVKVFYISGIYDTGMEELDAVFAVCDIKQIQNVNLWKKDQVSGIEISINNFDKIDELTDIIRKEISSYISESGEMFSVKNFKEDNPAIVSWLSLSDMNITVILTLMIIIAVLNMISGLLIVILERTNMIGILKSLGANNGKIRKIFIINGTYLIGKGLFWGNVIGVGLLLIQQFFHIIPLDTKVYYVDTVPVNINIFHLLLLNIGTLIITTVALIFPAMMISKISPAKAIKFE